MNRRVSGVHYPRSPAASARNKAGVGNHQGTASTARTGNKGKKRPSSILAIVTFFFGLLFVLVLALSSHVLRSNSNADNTNSFKGPASLLSAENGKPNSAVSAGAAKRGLSGGAGQPQSSSCHRRSYAEWRSVAVELASLPVDETLRQLETSDPFGTRRFEEQLTSEEERLGRTLERAEVRKLFPCPAPSGTGAGSSSCDDRITVPDRRKPERSRAFRRGDDGTFLFFQHLRKAGGTHFCSLAKANLPVSAVPRYFCMPDYKWSNWTGAGYLHKWSNADIARNMREAGHRVAGNEWDTFDPSRHFDLPAVFATSFRRPLDRALSQFRFECIEERGCKIKNVTQWWEHRKDLYNVYTITFADPPGHARYLKLMKAYEDGTSRENAKTRGEMIGAALDTVAQFDLVLVMEWLAYASPQVRDVLGFNNTSVLTQRVRPHLTQAKREDGQDTNKLGAASITKASWDPRKYLDPTQYKRMSRHLALDSILTDAARRMFLERLVCDT